MSLITKVDYILDMTDFEKIRSVMKFLNWKWADDNRTPTVMELRTKSQRLLFDTIAHWELRGQPKSGFSISTGGLVAEVVCFESGAPQLSLTFYVERWSAAA